jgi:hypothetical protein
MKTLKQLEQEKTELEILIKQQKAVLADEQKVEREKLSPKYQINKITKREIDPKWDKIDAKISYCFHLKLLNKAEYETHLQKYGSLNNPPDEDKISLGYCFIPIKVNDKEIEIDGNIIGIIATIGGGHHIFKEYVTVTLKDWTDFVTKGIIIKGLLSDYYKLTTIKL